MVNRETAPRRVDSDGSAISGTHLVIIPSFDSGPLLARTVAAARAHWAPVWVVIDGSTDDSVAAVDAMAGGDPGVRVLRLPRNRGKGAAVRHGMMTDTVTSVSGFGSGLGRATMTFIRHSRRSPGSRASTSLQNVETNGTPTDR